MMPPILRPNTSLSTQPVNTDRMMTPSVCGADRRGDPTLIYKVHRTPVRGQALSLQSAALAIPTTTLSRRQSMAYTRLKSSIDGTRRCASPSRPNTAMSAPSKPGVRARPRKWRAGASVRQGSNKAAWRRFQPSRHASPRSRPRTTTIPACIRFFHLRERWVLFVPRIRSSMPPCSGRPSPSLTVAALGVARLDRFCARRPSNRRSGRKRISREVASKLPARETSGAHQK